MACASGLVSASIRLAASLKRESGAPASTATTSLPIYKVRLSYAGATGNSLASLQIKAPERIFAHPNRDAKKTGVGSVAISRARGLAGVVSRSPSARWIAFHSSCLNGFRKLSVTPAWVAKHRRWTGKPIPSGIALLDAIRPIR